MGEVYWVFALALIVSLHPMPTAKRNKAQVSCAYDNVKGGEDPRDCI